MMKGKFLLVVCLFVFFPMIVLANSKLEVDNSNVEVALGEDNSILVKLSLDEKITKISFTMITTTYDIEPSFETDYNDKISGNTHTISFDNEVSDSFTLGKIILKTTGGAEIGDSGNINLYNVTLTLSDGNTKLIGNLLLNVKIVEEVTSVIENVYLSMIKSDIVNIELEKDKFDYIVYVNKELTELDLDAIPEDDNSLVSISSQKLNDDKTVIEIIVTAKSGKVGKYSITVIKENDKKEDNELKDDYVTIGESKVDNSYKIKWIVIIVISIATIIAAMFFVNKK